jgi:tetratricopeptide (TPR) repeat protein
MDSLINALKSLKSRTRFPRETLNVISSMAWGLMQQHQFERAYLYYNLLTLYDPIDTGFLTGQALCARELGRPGEALMLLDLATYIDPEQPLHALLAAECLLELDRVEEARELLPTIARFCAENSEYQAVGERAQALLSRV